VLFTSVAEDAVQFGCFRDVQESIGDPGARQTRLASPSFRNSCERTCSPALHRFAVPLIVVGDHGPLRRALASVGAHDVAADPWLSLALALANVEAGELSAAQGDLRHARRCWPAHVTVGLTALRAAAEQLGGHCCIDRGLARAGWADATPSRCASAAVQLRRVPVPTRGDHAGGALVPALQPCGCQKLCTPQATC
jgi:hypothetical protein